MQEFAKFGSLASPQTGPAYAKATARQDVCATLLPIMSHFPLRLRASAGKGLGTCDVGLAVLMATTIHTCYTCYQLYMLLRYYLPDFAGCRQPNRG